MKFNKLVEDFNIFPKAKNAVPGDSIGMTGMLDGNPESGFPNRKEELEGKLLPDEVQITLSKKLAKELLGFFTPKEK